MGASTAIESLEKNTTPEVISSFDRTGLFIRRYPPIEKIRFDPMRLSTSQDPDIASLLKSVRTPVFEGKVRGQIDKKFIPVDISCFRDVGMTTVKGALKVDCHRHPGTMFSAITAGEVSVNGVTLGRGDWYIVPPGVEYELESASGYEIFFAYDHSC